jgi:hypothetical protein
MFLLNLQGCLDACSLWYAGQKSEVALAVMFSMLNLRLVGDESVTSG